MLTRGVQPMLACCVLAGLLSACQGSVQGKQLDINYATTNGVGSLTGAPLKLPHGRYTFFSSSDPPDCVTSVALLDDRGTVVTDDAAQRAVENKPAPGAPAGIPTIAPNSVSNQQMPTLVQQELSSGSYRLKVTTRFIGCAWQVEQILNYVLSNEAPPKPVMPPSAPALDVALGNSSADLHFHIDVPGIYQFQWTITPCDRYSADLVRTGGGAVHLGDAEAASLPPGGGLIGPQQLGGPVFLGAGDWTARVSTRCFWQIAISPWRGPTGGGGQGFSG